MSRSKAPQPPVQEAPPPPPPPAPQNPVPNVLMEMYLKQRNEKDCDLAEFHHAKYEEWMKYFGFSMERELQWYRDDKQRAQSRTKSDRQGQTPISTGGSRAPTVTPLGTTPVPFSSLTHASPVPMMFSSPTPPPVSGIPDDNTENGGGSSSPAKSILKGGPKDNSSSVSVERGASSGGAPNKRDNEDPIQSQSIPMAAQHGLEMLHHFSTRLEDADKHAISTGALLGKSFSEIVAAVTEPYKKVTWRQDSCAVALLRTRALYCWICKNIKLDMPSNDSGKGREGGGVRFADAAPAATSSTPNHPSTPQRGAMKKSNTSANNNNTDDPSAIHLPTIKNKKGGGGKGESADAQCQAVLDLRRGDPRKLSVLFTEMLQVSGVESTSVKGALKGVLDSKGKPMGFLPRWGWNVVTIPYPDNANELFPGCNIPIDKSSGGMVMSAMDSLSSMHMKDANTTLHMDRHIGGGTHHQKRPTMQLLIDVSLSLAFVGPRVVSHPSIDKDADGAGGVTSAPVSPRDAKVANSGGKGTGQKGGGASGNAAAAAALEQSEEQQAEKRAQLLKAMQAKTWEAQHANYSAANPTFTHYHDLSTHYEPFYFGCDPRMFVSLHYPEEAHKDALLLDRPVSKPMWETYPRLDHTFYKYGLLLDSHRRKCQFIVKSAPFYVSFLLQDPAHVEMTASIYQGTLSQLPSSDWNKMPPGKKLGPGFVYSMREERSHRQTFTLMTPDVGQHTIVFGARHVHRDKNAHDVSNEPFDVVAMYNVSVSFVALNEPILPHQHLSPATVKLVEPSSHKILLGPQRFTVVPTSTRVIGVAVVNYLDKEKDKQQLASSNGSRSQSRILDSGVSSSLGQSQTPKPLQGLPPISQQPAANQRKSSLVKKGRVGTPVESVTSDSQAIPQKTAAELREEAREKLLKIANITLLELNPETATFSGEVKVEQGTCEIWTLIGDPSSIVAGATQKLLSATKLSGAGKAALASTIENNAAALAAETSADVNAGRAKNSAGKDPSSKTSKASGTKQGGKGAALKGAVDDAAASDALQSALLTVVEEPIEIANGSGGAIRGMFVPAITHLHAVRRILPKEATLNDGKEVIQPVMLEKKRLYADLPFVFRLLCTAEVIGAPGMAERRKRKPPTNPYTQLEKEKSKVAAQQELDRSVRVGGAPLIEMQSMQSPSARAKIKNLSDAENLVLKPLNPVGQYFTA